MYLVAMPLYLHHPIRPLEISFPATLHQTVAEGIDFGSEVMYTFGPFGYLAFPQLYFPTTSLLAMIAGIGVGLAATFVTLWSLSRVVPIVVASVATYLMLVIGWNRLLEVEWMPEVAGAVVAVVCLAMITRSIDEQSPYVALLPTAMVFGVISAFFGLVKVSTGIQIGAVTVTTLWVVASDGVRPSWGQARLIGAWLGSLLVSGLVLWVAAGQAVGDLTSFVRYSLEIVSGYAGAMGIEAPRRGWERPMALLLVVVLGWVIVERWGLGTIRRNPLLVLPVCAYLFTAFKHGFVRHDQHALVFFVTVSFLALGVMSRDNAGPSLSVVGFGLLAAWLSAGLAVPVAVGPRAHVEQSFDVARLVLDRSERIDEIVEAREGVRERHPLSPETLQLLAGRRVHADPLEIGMLWAYLEFDWGAPPVFEPHVAYTVELDDLNAEFLASENAPEYILRRGIAIDGRHPAFESPAYMVEMACRYRSIARDGPWEVLERAESGCGDIEPLSGTAVALGEWVSVPEAEECDGSIVFSIEGLDTFGQKLRSLLYKDAQYSLRTDAEVAYRLVPATAGQPHLMPGESSPVWLGNRVVEPGAEFTIEKQGHTLLTPDRVEIEFGCLTSR